MENFIVIKGNKNGIVVVLDALADFDTLKDMVAQKFQDSAKFLGYCKTAIAFSGRDLSDEEELELLDIISANSDLDIVCLLDSDTDRNEIGINEAAKRETVQSEPEVFAAEERLKDYPANMASFYKGNLRSGQTLEMENSVIVLGDVNPGANITSNGNILVLGSLKGTAYAGAAGNRNAFVFALDMNPMQIRLADVIARAPDNPERNTVKEPKIAYLEDENIYIEVVSKSVLNDINI